MFDDYINVRALTSVKGELLPLLAFVLQSVMVFYINEQNMLLIVVASILFSAYGYLKILGKFKGFLDVSYWVAFYKLGLWHVVVGVVAWLFTYQILPVMLWYTGSMPLVAMCVVLGFMLGVLYVSYKLSYVTMHLLNTRLNLVRCVKEATSLTRVNRGLLLVLFLGQFVTSATRNETVYPTVTSYANQSLASIIVLGVISSVLTIAMIKLYKATLRGVESSAKETSEEPTL